MGNQTSRRRFFGATGALAAAPATAAAAPCVAGALNRAVRGGVYSAGRPL